MASHGELPISSDAHIRCLARLSLHRPTTLGSPAPENRNRATTHAHMLLRRPYPQRGNATGKGEKQGLVREYLSTKRT